MFRKIKNFLSYLYLFLTGAISEQRKQSDIQNIIQKIKTTTPNAYPYVPLATFDVTCHSTEFIQHLIEKGYSVISTTNVYSGGKNGVKGVFKKAVERILQGENILLKVCSVTPSLGFIYSFKEFCPTSPYDMGDMLENWKRYLDVLCRKDGAFDDHCRRHAYMVAYKIELYYIPEDADDPMAWMVEQDIKQTIEATELTVDLEYLEVMTQRAKDEIKKLEEAILESNSPTVVT